MNLKAPTIVLSLFVIFSSTLTNAFNITKILSDASDFSSFNDLLTQTGLAEKINSRSTITVLALDGGAVGSLQGMPKDEGQRILSNHVILDYYDIKKLRKLPNKTATLTTLFQTSGSAKPGQGFLNVTDTHSGDIMFGSGVKDAPLSAKVVKSVFSEPFNISVIQISQAIVAPGVDAPSPQPANSPSESPRKAPSPSSDQSEAPDSDSPPPVDSTDDESKSADSTPPPTESGAASALCSRAAIGIFMVLVLSLVGF